MLFFLLYLIYFSLSQQNYELGYHDYVVFYTQQSDKHKKYDILIKCEGGNGLSVFLCDDEQYEDFQDYLYVPSGVKCLHKGVHNLTIHDMVIPPESFFVFFNELSDVVHLTYSTSGYTYTTVWTLLSDYWWTLLIVICVFTTVFVFGFIFFGGTFVIVFKSFLRPIKAAHNKAKEFSSPSHPLFVGNDGEAKPLLSSVEYSIENDTFGSQVFEEGRAGQTFESLHRTPIHSWTSKEIELLLESCWIEKGKEETFSTTVTNLPSLAAKFNGKDFILEFSSFSSSVEFFENQKRTIRTKLKENENLTRKFFSVLRCCQFYGAHPLNEVEEMKTTFGLPLLFSNPVRFRNFLQKHQFGFLWSSIKEKKLNLAYLLERSDEELNLLFPNGAGIIDNNQQMMMNSNNNNSTFGKLFQNMLRTQIIEKEFSVLPQEYQFYLRCVHHNPLKFRNFQTVHEILNGTFQYTVEDIEREENERHATYSKLFLGSTEAEKRHDDDEEEEEEEPTSQCCLCLSNKCDVLFEPCRHVCICSECLENVNTKVGDECYICRTKISKIEKVFIN